jgi:hypothetical protein
MNYSFTKDLSSALVNQIKSDEIEYIFAKSMNADALTLQFMRNRIRLMKLRLKQKRGFTKSRIKG